MVDDMLEAVLLGLLAWAVIELSRAQASMAEDIRLVAENPVLYRAKYAASGDSDTVKEQSL